MFKIGAIIVIAIVVILIGMNQYESYKLNSKVNNAIESITDTQELINKLKADLSTVKSAIVTERQTRLIGGDPTYINSLSSDDSNLFDKILLYPIKAGTSQGKWSRDGNMYMYHIGNYKTISFEYSNKDGSFNCYSNCSLVPYL